MSDLGDVVFFVALTYAAAQLGSPTLAAIVLASGTGVNAVVLIVVGFRFGVADAFYEPAPGIHLAGITIDRGR